MSKKPNLLHQQTHKLVLAHNCPFYKSWRYLTDYILTNLYAKISFLRRLVWSVIEPDQI